MGVTKVGAIVVKMGAKDFSLAVEAGDTAAIKSAVGTVKAGQAVANVGAGAAKVIGGFQIMQASVDLLIEFQKLNGEEASGAISHAVARRRRLGLAANALQQMAQHAASESESVREEAAKIGKGVQAAPEKEGDVGGGKAVTEKLPPKAEGTREAKSTEKTDKHLAS
jgi:hypothetical protein